MREFLIFVHIIASMVLLGLPMTFGRWFSASQEGDNPTAAQSTVAKIYRMTVMHLNLASVAVLVTGVWIASAFGYWKTGKWAHTAPLLVILIVLNINLVLAPALGKLKKDWQKNHATTLTKRLKLFSALHHTLVTLTTLLMVFKPF